MLKSHHGILIVTEKDELDILTMVPLDRDPSTWRVPVSSSITTLEARLPLPPDLSLRGSSVT